MFQLRDFTDAPRGEALRAKDAVLAGSSTSDAGTAPPTIRCRKHWGVLQGLVDEMMSASAITLQHSEHVERLTLQGDEIASAYSRQLLAYDVRSEGQGAFVISRCTRQRMAEDRFLATLLPALAPLYEQRFDSREDFEAKARPLLAPLLPQGTQVKDGTDPPLDRVLRALALIARLSSTWARAMRVRQAVDSVLYPERALTPDAAAADAQRRDLTEAEAGAVNPGEIVRQWTYYDYAGPRPPGGEHDGPRLLFDGLSLADSVHLDSTAVATASLCRSARNQTADLVRLMDLLTADDESWAGVPVPNLARAYWDRARPALAQLQLTIGEWLLSPRVQRLPLIAEAMPSSPAFSNFGAGPSIIVDLRGRLDAERAVPAPTYTLHFQTDRPRLADMALGEPAMPLREILQDPGQLDTLVAQVTQLDLEALDPLAIELHGHTDKSSTEAHNQALSERRAQWLLDRMQARCPGHWRIDDAVLAALERAGADACALEDLATLAGRRYPHQRSNTLAILEAIVGRAAAARLYPVIETSAVRPVFAQVAPIVGHGEADATGPDNNPLDRRAQARITALATPR